MPHDGIVFFCQTVQVAGGKSAQTAVAQTGVRFALVDVGNIYFVVFFESVGKRIGHLHVEQIVFEASTHQKLHRKVVNPFALPCFVFLVECRTLFQKHIADNRCDAFVHLPDGKIGRVYAVGFVCGAFYHIF